MALPTLLDRLPRFYDYRDILALFPSEADFAEAWVRGDIPHEVQQVCLASMPARYLEILLLARMCRQLDALAQLLREGEVTVFEDPAPQPRKPPRH